ncbi:MAG: ABC transporter substrate-binding protein [Betaproteobacteria bacterium]|nr:ABC transporter substrate-binding protein [Betaproteobacteria bacterium]
MNEKTPAPRSLLARLFRRGGAAADTEQAALKEFLLLGAVALVVVGLAFWVASRFVRPAPPDDFVIATGSESGAYHLYGKRYQELLAKDKIRVELAPSSGSVENLQRLTAESGAAVAFVQGGVGNPAEQHGLVTLAALYYEPLWIFYRGNQELSLLNQLAGKRLAIGPEGSGTRALALTVLGAAGAARDPGALLPLSGTDATDALVAAKVDAALFVAGPDAPVVQRLLRTPGVRLMSMAQADALSRRFAYLATVSLPQGVIDLATDVPPRDLTLVATTAYLVAREDFHPALVSVLLQAAQRVHRAGGVFQRNGEFPAARDGDFPLSEDAQRFFRSGPPFLQRYMPFWVANLLERLLVLLVPLIAVMIPVIRIFPGVYNWRVRLRVFRWYRQLRAVELESAENPSPERVAELLAQLDEIQDGVNRTRVPLTYSDYAYNLKLHIDLVRSRLRRAA